MSTTFANQINNLDIYAARAVADKDGNQLDTTYAKSSDLATVATTGDYDDLSNKPTIPAAQVNSDWNASSGVAEILNKPSLATVATSGDYNDLSNQPTIRNVPASTSSDATKVLTVDSQGDAAWSAPAGLFEATYGTTTFVDIVSAINANKIVYCKIPAPGATARMAFLAYVGSTNIEFQYYRSLSSHTAANQVDEVYVYTISSTTGWSTTTRKAGSVVTAGTHMSQSYNSSTSTLTLDATWPTVDQTYDGSSTNAQSGTAIAGALATKEDAFTVGTGLEMDTTGGTNTLQVEAPVDIVAGPGIAIDNPDGNTLRVSNSNSEVVLWDGNGTAASSCVLSEHPSNFERLILYVGESAYIDCHSCPGSNGNIRIASVSGGSNSWLSFYFIKRTNLTLEVVGDKRLNFGGIDATTASYTVTIGNKSILWKVVGVNRIANN